MHDLIALARDFALVRHEGQIDRDGNPHTDHCGRVAAAFEADPALAAAAWLHDIMEDTDCGLGEIDVMFGTYVAQIVLLLTRGKCQSFKNYLHQIAGCGDGMRFDSQVHRSACAIKIADIQDNLSRCDTKMEPKRPMYEDALVFLSLALWDPFPKIS